LLDEICVTKFCLYVNYQYFMKKISMHKKKIEALMFFFIVSIFFYVSMC